MCIRDSYLPNGPDIPIPIDDQVQVVNGPLIYVVTGWNDNRNVRDIQVYDTRTDSWSAATSLPNNQYPAFGASGTLIDNTIYYYGGANGNFFQPRNELRIGVISETNPLEIDWSLAPLANRSTIYRNAATEVEGRPVWIGGATNSYNFDGFAYDGSGGVQPYGQVNFSNPLTNEWIEFAVEVPMDLRSVAEISSFEKIIAGGMKAGQSVTNETLRVDFSGVSDTENLDSESNYFTLYPNPTEAEVTMTISQEVDLQLPVEFRNINGQLVKRITAKGNRIKINLSELQSGMYIISLGEAQRKLIVK